MYKQPTYNLPKKLKNGAGGGDFSPPELIEAFLISLLKYLSSSYTGSESEQKTPSCK
jgi:hypothetical protein